MNWIWFVAELAWAFTCVHHCQCVETVISDDKFEASVHLMIGQPSAKDFTHSPVLCSQIDNLMLIHCCCMLIMLFLRFHVDKMSSAHVYVRLHKGQSLDDISEALLEDCAQLVKANSIQGKSTILLNMLLVV